jgi:hypothetical protein
MNRSSSPRFTLLLASLFFMQAACMAQADKPQKDEELQQMVIEDQRERSNIRGKAWPEELTARDRTRRANLRTTQGGTSSNRSRFQQRCSDLSA